MFKFRAPLEVLKPYREDEHTGIVTNADAFIAAARAHQYGIVTQEDYRFSPEVDECLAKMGYRDIAHLTPQGGVITIQTDQTLMTIDPHHERIPDPLIKEIEKLARIHGRAIEHPHIRFTLSAIRAHDPEERCHVHYTPYMTMGFKGLSTEWKDSVGATEFFRGPDRAPIYIAKNQHHRSPFMRKDDERLICTFFPV
jgi:hypothetical protein